MKRTITKFYWITKPGIIRGNAMTAAAGFLFASHGDIDSMLLVAVICGTSLVIASACVLNNYIDRGIDAKMARTKKRALVSGEISGQNAIIYAAVLGLIGFSILVMYTNWLTVVIGLIAVLFYVIVYGYSKRRSEHGTLVGTVPGAASLVAGYVAVTNDFDVAAVILFLIMVFWQMPHFYAIAIRRKAEYAAAGIPVLPVKKNVRITKLQMLVYIVAYIAAAASLAVYGYAGYTYLTVMTLIGTYWFWQGVKGFKSTKDTAWAGKMFGFSLVVLMVFSIVISLDTWLP